MIVNSADGVVVAYPLFQEDGGGSIPTSALSFRVVGIGVQLACQLNRRWHSLLPRIAHNNVYRNTHYSCFAAEFGNRFFGVAIWTSPTVGPQVFNLQTTLELRRFALCSATPKNSASRMLSVMVRLLRQKFPHLKRFISYQDTERHTGTIYRAAGWTATAKSFDQRDRGKRCGRKRNASQTTAIKQRWELNYD